MEYFALLFNYFWGLFIGWLIWGYDLPQILIDKYGKE